MSAKPQRKLETSDLSRLSVLRAKGLSNLTNDECYELAELGERQLMEQWYRK